mmetsp:Transcript_12742/g.28210  ORF Transcript_12742/g.28210 Transcript_12742/m.28210 type:complete len:357 (-) Transcript_12742:106-1176(-)
MGCCDGKICKLCGLVTLQVLLLVWAIAAVLFSALTVGTCEFLSIPLDNLSELPAEGDDTYTFTGKVGLFLVQEVDSAGYERCTEVPGYIYDSFSTFFRVAQLMGVVALTAGAVAAIVLILTFFMEMCCAVTGLQYGLGIIFLIACITQGLTFMTTGDGVCSGSGSGFECELSTSSIWSIVAIALYFIAMVQSFAAPFPKEKLCSKQACCKCCQKEEEEVHDDEKDVEAQEAALEPVDDNAAAAAAAAGVAGGAAAGAGVAVAVADDDEEQNEEDKLDNEEDAAAASTTGNDEDAVDMTVLDEDQKALDEEAAAATASAASAPTASAASAPTASAASAVSGSFKSATSVGVGDMKQG